MLWQQTVNHRRSVWLHLVNFEVSNATFVFAPTQQKVHWSNQRRVATCCYSNVGASHLFSPTMTGSSSFPSDRWRGPTIKQEQKSLSQPKPCRVVLIVRSRAVGTAYLIAAITNFPRKDGQHLFRFWEWFLLGSFLWEGRRMRNKERDSSPQSEQIGRSPAESKERLRHLANAFATHDLQQTRRRLWLALWQPTEVCARGHNLPCVGVRRSTYSEW